MLQRFRGLTPESIAAIQQLDARAVAVDGGRLKLEYGTLRSRDDDVVNDLLRWDGDRLIGFLGLYSFGGGSVVELGGVVDPGARRQGIGTALVDAALTVVAEREWTTTLLVVPRNDAGGTQFAAHRGGVLDHSEHSMQLPGEPTDGPTDPRVTIRDAGPGDLEAQRHILTEAFGYEPSGEPPRAGTRHLMIEHDGEPVGCVRITIEGDLGGVYGFAVAAERRGQGIGRDVLRRVCQELRTTGATRVGLEVEVTNEQALGLYTSVGFERIETEDYYRLPPT